MESFPVIYALVGMTVSFIVVMQFIGIFLLALAAALGGLSWVFRAIKENMYGYSH